MRERSPYEGTHDERLAGQVALGRIISVNPETRRCRVKTLGKPGRTDDLDLTDVQWISLSNGPDGSDDTTLPTPNQYGVIIFINSEPYIMGYYQPMAATGTPERADKEPLLPGDRVIKTIAGNKIILRSGGTVEIESTKICRVYFIPSRNLMSMLCQELEFDCDGGLLYWTRDRKSDNTLMNLRCYNNFNFDMAMDFQIGMADDGSLFKAQLGPTDDNLNITPNLVMRIQPSGDTDLNIGQGKLTLSIQAGSGNLTLTTKGNVTQNITGNVTQTVQGEVDLTSKGETKVTAEKILLNGESSGITTENSHEGVIDLITGVPVEPSTTVFSDI